MAEFMGNLKRTEYCGELNLENAEGGGTLVTVLLPIGEN